jgi:hypothetical protein
LGSICLDSHAFWIENVPTTYQRTMSMAFREYLKVFMKFFWMTSMYLMTLKRTLPNFGYVFKNAMNSVSTWIWRSACFWFTQGSYFNMLSPRWENYLIQKRSWQSWICPHRKHLKT